MEKVNEMNAKYQTIELAESYDENLAKLKEIFKDDGTFKTGEFTSADGKRRYCVAFCSGLCDTNVISKFLMRPLMINDDFSEKDSAITHMQKKLVEFCDMRSTKKFADIIESVTYGDTLLFTDNCAEGLLADTKSFTTRSIAEPDEEKILSGPREGFNESLMQNLSLVRRKLRTNELKIKFLTLGRRTKTQLAITYIEGIADKEVLKELEKRLEKINIDGMLETNYVNELIREDKSSPFRTIGETERPDVLVGKMLEGRIGLFVDGTPVALTLPFLFVENFQTPEDYYIDYYEAGFSRLLRMAGFLAAISVPAVYIAIVAFHHEILPSSLMISIAVERQNVPLPAGLEAFMMLIVFYILRESGLRMPSNVGQAMSIVGALVIGQAAVQAKLVAAPMIIVVALTGITSLLVPKMTAPTMMCCFGLLACATAFGFFGLTLGATIISVHILGLKSFGVVQMFPDEKFTAQRFKDIFIRAPWPDMRTRPEKLTENHIRQEKTE